MNETVCYQIAVTGIVQGVGFRPFVYHLACELGLGGTVCNSGQGVLIQIEGSEKRVKDFVARLQANPPLLARVNSCRVEERPPQGYKTFSISRTRGSSTGESLVPPDVATCADCRREVTDVRDRHYRYPFTNCTNCGPRFTIVSNLPYDRKHTSMASFYMCENCAGEYRNPADRRFHAQPVACPRCGPKLYLADRYGDKIEGDWLDRSRQLLATGKILAVKSLGGFHLTCNGEDPDAISRLRCLKGRPAKPLVVMCPDVATVRRYCYLSFDEEALLCSSSAPVVVLTKLPNSSLPEELGPGLNSVGVMLPYTPLHILLTAQGLPVLVMTSGNRSGMPLVTANDQALSELKGIADYFLLHDRDIVNRCDDSVTGIVCGRVQFYRRSRGYVPAPIHVPTGCSADGVVYLGAGGDKKNTFCLLKSGRAYLSQHIGSVDTLEGQAVWQQSLDNFCRLLEVEPRVAAFDLHPEFHSAALAKKLGCEETVAVQHHHGHMAACMAENGLDGDVIGLILDGTGYGLDGNIWGGEVLSGGYTHFCRDYYISYMPLPGGDRAVQNPWMTAVAYLIVSMGDEGYRTVKNMFTDKIKHIEIIRKMLERNVNCPLTSSCGRLFDAVSALTGVCSKNTYEGQAAIQLGDIVPAAGYETLEPYSFQLQNGVMEINLMLRDLIKDIQKGVPRTRVAKRFHDTIAVMLADAVSAVRSERGLNRVVLSGGCWLNRYLFCAVQKILTGRDFEVFSHSKVPAGDGGIALGQAVIASYHF